MLPMDRDYKLLSAIVVEQLHQWADDALGGAEGDHARKTWHSILGSVASEAHLRGIAIDEHGLSEANRVTEQATYLAFLRAVAANLVSGALSDAERLRGRVDPAAIGVLSAWRRAIACIQDQAEVVGIGLEKLGLDKIDPDNDIMGAI